MPYLTLTFRIDEMTEAKIADWIAQGKNFCLTIPEVKTKDDNGETTSREATIKILYLFPVGNPIERDETRD